MFLSSFREQLLQIFGDESLFGFAAIDDRLAKETGCKCSLVTLLPYPDLQYKYSNVEYLIMTEALWGKHSAMINEVKAFLDENSIQYATPSASTKKDGNLRAEYSYKWAAIHAGLGFIGKNDVFVHPKYAQRVRISCLLIDYDVPVFSGSIESKCGECDICVRACPHHLITGRSWDINIMREELIDYNSCNTKSNYEDEAEPYACAQCLLSCKYGNYVNT